MWMEIESFARHVLTIADSFGTSDIHILPEQKHYMIYFRLNGQMEQHFYLDLEEGVRLISYFKFLANMDVGEKRKPQSGSLVYELNEKELDMRFSTISNFRSNESLVIRLLDKKQQKSSESRSFFKKELKELTKLVQYKSGLILFSGPVDSGKTTTMYHLIRNRSSEEKQQVISIEDPVEIEEPGFLQVQVNEQAGVTYEHLLKSSLRHHPDVLIVGEIRDEETAKMVVRGALTGHLIIASVHAKNPSGVVSRLMELGISKALLSQTIIGIVFQKLLPLYCGLCEGNCHSYCTHHSSKQKRSALIDLRTGTHLNKLFTQDIVQENHEKYTRSFNHLLKRIYTYGYITEQVYSSYQIP